MSQAPVPSTAPAAAIQADSFLTLHYRLTTQDGEEVEAVDAADPRPAAETEQPEE